MPLAVYLQTLSLWQHAINVSSSIILLALILHSTKCLQVFGSVLHAKLVRFFLNLMQLQEKMDEEKNKMSRNECEVTVNYFCFLIIQVCHRGGTLICCETCPRVFHLRCIGLVKVPEGDYLCNICVRVHFLSL